MATYDTNVHIKGTDPTDLGTATNPLNVTGGGSGTQYADGATRGTATGTLMMVDDGWDRPLF